MKSEMAPAGGRDVDRFDQWAASYDRTLLQRLFFVPIHKAVLDLLAQEGSPSRLLDVGCGTGRLLRAAEKRWPNAELLGVDPAANMVAEARRLNPSATFMVTAAESLPFHAESIDAVTSSMSFHHWGNQAKGIEEIARVLRPGGLFCLADHTFLPARLTGERPCSRIQVHDLMAAVGLAVLRQRPTRLPFLLISLACKS